MKVSGNMIVDISWASGFVVGIQHNDEAVIFDEEDNTAEMCNAILIHLGFFTVAILFASS